MHVGCGAGNLTKRWRFECAVIGCVTGDCETAFISETAGAPSDSSVVESFIREVRTEMASGAVSSSSKDSKSELLLGGERRAIAVDKAIVRRIAGENASDIAGKRAG